LSAVSVSRSPRVAVPVFMVASVACRTARA
jgi:hypothetical protein